MKYKESVIPPLIQFAVLVTASLRWAISFMYADGYVIPETWTWVPIVSGVLGAAMAVAEGCAFVYVFSVLARIRGRNAALLAVSAAAMIASFVAFLSPSVYARVTHTPVHEFLPPWALWGWTISAILSCISTGCCVGIAHACDTTAQYSASAYEAMRQDAHAKVEEAQAHARRAHDEMVVAQEHAQVMRQELEQAHEYAHVAQEERIETQAHAQVMRNEHNDAQLNAHIMREQCDWYALDAQRHAQAAQEHALREKGHAQTLRSLRNTSAELAQARAELSAIHALMPHECPECAYRHASQQGIAAHLRQHNGKNT